MNIIVKQRYPGYSYGSNKGGTSVVHTSTEEILYAGVVRMTHGSARGLVTALGLPWEDSAEETARKAVNIINDLLKDGNGGCLPNSNWRAGQFGEYSVHRDDAIAFDSASYYAKVLRESAERKSRIAQARAAELQPASSEKLAALVAKFSG